MRLTLSNELLDAQLLRTAGAAPYGGADIGECLAAAAATKGTDLDTWYRAWWSLAEAVERTGRDAETAGATETACRAYLRASAYYRTAGVMHMSPDDLHRLKGCFDQQRTVFRRGAALLSRPPELLDVTIGSSTVTGYFFSAADPGQSACRPTLILVGGYDGTAEELYFANGAAALGRGYHVVAFDGPGQGAALAAGVSLRPDWENVIGPIIDRIVDRPDVDPARIALVGWSLGGFLAPRAAAREHRLAAVAADCGSFDLQSSFLAQVPPPLASAYRSGNAAGRKLLGAVLSRVAKRPVTGWALRRGMLVHGRSTPLAYLDELQHYSMATYAADIRCPVWISYAEGDDISATAPQLAEALTVPHELVRFTAAEGADNHCEAGARLLFHARLFGWLDAQLGTGPDTP